MQKQCPPTEHARGGLAPAQWGGREPPASSELLGGKRALGGVSVTRTSVLTPPHPGLVLLSTYYNLFYFGGDPSVEVDLWV